ncbi:hypothetical protein [Stenotrophomonas phage SOVA965]
MTSLHRMLISLRICAMLYAAAMLLIGVRADESSVWVWGGAIIAAAIALGVTAWEEWK